MILVRWQHGGPSFERCLAEGLQPRAGSLVMVRRAPVGASYGTAPYMVRVWWQWQTGDCESMSATFGVSL